MTSKSVSNPLSRWTPRSGLEKSPLIRSFIYLYLSVLPVKHDILELNLFAVPDTDKEDTHRTQMIRLSDYGEAFSVISTNILEGFHGFTLRNDLQYSPYLVDLADFLI